MLNERAEASGFIHVQKGALSIVKMIVHHCITSKEGFSELDWLMDMLQAVSLYEKYSQSIISTLASGRSAYHRSGYNLNTRIK